MKKDKLRTVIEKNFKDQVFFLQSLVQTKSANPFTPDKSNPQSPVELEVARIIENKLREIGLRPKRVAMFPEERPNIVAKIKSKGGGKKLIFNGHMDTVIPASTYTFNPYSGTVKNGRLFGVGASDMKASLSCFVFMAKALKDLKIKPAGDIILTFVIDEEISSCSPYGTAYLLKKGLKGDAAIIAEPKTDKIVVGHRGRYIFKITTFGEAAHTGMKEWERGEKGHNAILDMAEIINALKDLKVPYSPSSVFPGVKSIFTFPTIIKGGIAINIVPEKCIAYGDSRLLPSSDPTQVRQMILEKLKPLKAKVKFKMEDVVKFPGAQIDPKEKIVQILHRVAVEILGRKPEIRGCRPATDGWMLIKKGIPTVCGFGPDGGGIHSKDEYVELESVKKVTEIFTRTTIEFLKTAS